MVIARRYGDQWFIAGINGESESKELTLDLSFIPKNFTGELITDGEGSEIFTKKSVSPSEELSVKMDPNGGFVMLFEK